MSEYNRDESTVNSESISPESMESSSATITDPEIQKGLSRQRGTKVLSDMLAANALGDHPQEDPADHAGTILSSGLYDDKKPDSFRDIENEKRTKDIHKLLEDLGNGNVDPLNDKSREKFLVKANKLVSKGLGARRLSLNDAKAVTHAVLLAASKGSLLDLQSVIEHATKHAKNSKAIQNRVDGLFGEAMPKDEPVSDKERDGVNNHVAENHLGDQIEASTNLAEGGEVAQPLVNSTIASLHPERAALLAGAKTRAYEYLNSLRPQLSTKLPFDSKPDASRATKAYHDAIDVAKRPLSILNQIKDGSVSPSKFQHFATMHSELHDLLKKQIAKRIVEPQLEGDDKKPPYKIRQGLSLFMGTPLESSLTPASIQAAQNVFMQKKPQQSQPMPNKAKKGTSTLGKSNKSYTTPEQAAEADSAKRD